MMHHLKSIVCCMKSKESYDRIVESFDSNEIIHWEEYIPDIDYLREKIAVYEYDLAVVDEKLLWKDEAINLFKKKDIPIIIFKGDFNIIIDNILEYIPGEDIGVDNGSGSYNDAYIDDREIRYIETERIIEKEVKVKVPVYKTVYTGLEKKTVMIVNLSKRAGSTFLTLNLARYLANNKILVSVIEPPIDMPYIFDTIGLELKLEAKEEGASLRYYSYPHMIANNEIIRKGVYTIEDGILWLVPDSRKPIIADWNYNNMVKLIYASNMATITIIDCGDNIEHESIKPLLDSIELIIVVIDPLPTECMQNNEKLLRFIELKKKGIPIEFVCNRWNTGINRNEFFDFMKIEPLALIPAIDYELVYKAYYECKFPIDYPEVEKEIIVPISNIVKTFIPAEYFIDLDKKGSTNKSRAKRFLNIFRRE